MEFSKRLNLIRNLVYQEGYSKEMVIGYMIDEKIHHSTATLIIASIYNLDQNQAEKIIYKNNYYAKFRNEENPFNKEYLE